MKQYVITLKSKTAFVGKGNKLFFVFVLFCFLFVFVFVFLVDILLKDADTRCLLLTGRKAISC